MRYEWKMFLIITGAWIVFYLLFSWFLKLFTESRMVVVLSFLLFVIINFVIFPAAYYYYDSEIMINLPIDFLVSITGSDLFFTLFVFIVLGPIAFWLNMLYLIDLIHYL